MRFRGFLKWLLGRKTTLCDRLGHDLHRQKSDHLHYQKAEQPLVYCFSGEIENCLRDGCDHEEFFGDPKEYRIGCAVKAATLLFAALLLFLTASVRADQAIGYLDDHTVLNSTGMPILSYGPKKVIFDSGHGNVGYLSWERDHLVFRGNASKSARVFFEEFVKPMADEYVRNRILQEKETMFEDCK